MRKRADEDLAKSNDLLSATSDNLSKIIDTIPDASCITRLADGMFLEINQAFSDITGYTPEELLGHTSLSGGAALWTKAEDRGRMVAALRTKGEVVSMEMSLRMKDGTTRTSLLSARILEINGGKCILTVAHDIDERKRMEEALKRSEMLFSSAFRMSPAATILSDLKDGLCIDANEAYARLVGFSRDELVGKTTTELNIWMSAEERNRLVSGLAKAGRQQDVPITLRRKDGSLRSTLAFGEILVIEGKQCILSFFFDITERKQAEQAIRESEREYCDLADSLPLVIFEMDASGLFTYANRTALEWFGYSEADLSRGINVLQLVVEDDQKKAVENIRKVIGLGVTSSSEYSVKRKDGSIFPVLASSRPIVREGRPGSIRGILFDITERKNIESVLNNAQKLESLGVLAGGIAHDFNNLLTGIYGYIDLARRESKDGQTTEYLETTLATMNRARALTLQLLTFAKGGAPAQKITSLTPFIQETVQFALSGSNISYKFFLQENLWPCNIDKDQIGQVIDNIVINAQQAMPSGGNVEIAVHNVSLGEKEHPPLMKGNYVKVSIRDFGIGIPREILPRIFDPFYTTKTKGHGLGLATCYSIINRHGGCIDVESDQGKGSTFHVYLPASTQAVVADTASIVRHKGCGTIIIVDDEEAIRNAIQRMLELLGYTVACKNDGKEAIDFYSSETKTEHTFAAMIFDLTVAGGMGGMETVAKIRKLNTEIPVFVMSGYADDPVITNPVDYGFTASISKPFTIDELSAMLNRYLVKQA